MKPPRPLRLATYNIHSGVGTDGRYDLARIGQVLARRQPDIVCLQEVERNVGGKAGEQWKARGFSAAHADDQVSELSRLAGLPHTAYCASFETCLDEERTQSAGQEVLVCQENCGTWGNGFLSRWPITEQKVLRFTPTRERSPQVFEDGQRLLFTEREEQPRTALAVKIEVPGADQSGPVPLWIVNTHLSHQPFSAEQQGQASQVLKWLQSVGEFDAPALLAGDFNSFRGMPRSGYRVFMDSGTFTDPWTQFGVGWSWSKTTSPMPYFLGWLLRLRARIDHVLVPAGSAYQAANLAIWCDSEDERTGSDHTAVGAEVVLSATPDRSS